MSFLNGQALINVKEPTNLYNPNAEKNYLRPFLFENRE